LNERTRLERVGETEKKEIGNQMRERERKRDNEGKRKKIEVKKKPKYTTLKLES
jgi:hypothetical protein